MKEFFTIFKQAAKVSGKRFKMLLGVSAGVAVLAMSLTVFAGWSPDRPVFDWNNQADRFGSINGPRMNAFINTPYYGDERAFFDARMSDSKTFKDVLSGVTSGTQTVVLRTYIHNGANQSYNGSNLDGKSVATGAKIRIDLPTGVSTALRARSYIDITNPAPGYPAEVTDTAEMVDGNAFSIKYVPGSAVIYNAAHNSGLKLPDSIVTTGTALGYQNMDGRFPGCFEFQAIVEIKVQVQPAQVKLTKEVKAAVGGNYGSSASVKVGDTAQWRIFFQNTGQVDLHNVDITDKLPAHLRVVPNSVRWIYQGVSGNTEDVVQSDTALFAGPVNFGTWKSGGGFYLRFDTIALDDFSGCQATVPNTVLMKSTETPNFTQAQASLTITKTNCQPTPTPTPPHTTPPTLPNTGAGDMAGLFGATSAFGYIAHRLRGLRKTSKR